MIDALIQGRIYDQPTQRTSKIGKPFAVCKVRVATSAEDSIFCNVIAFDDEVVTALLAMGDGDSIALAGALTPKVWVDKQGVARPVLDIVAHKLLTPYHVSRKRRTVAKDDSSKPFSSGAPRPPMHDNDFPDDDLNF